MFLFSYVSIKILTCSCISHVWIYFCDGLLNVREHNKDKWRCLRIMFIRLIWVCVTGRFGKYWVISLTWSQHINISCFIHEQYKPMFNLKSKFNQNYRLRLYRCVIIAEIKKIGSRRFNGLNLVDRLMKRLIYLE